MSNRLIRIPIETNTKMRDSYAKSLIVRELAQIQYQICITHLNLLLLLPCHQSLPLQVLTHHAALSELTVSQVRILQILTSHVPLFRASRATQVTHLHPNMTFMSPRFQCGREMENLSTSSEVSWVPNRQKKRWSKHLFLEPS